MSKQDFKFKTPIRVRHMEGDAQGIVFNGAYLGYLEIAQAEYFRNLGFSIYRIARAGYFDTAVVKTTLEFKAPARVDQMLDLHARVVAIGTTSLTLEVEIYPQDSDSFSPPSRRSTWVSLPKPARPDLSPGKSAPWWTTSKQPDRCCR